MLVKLCAGVSAVALALPSSAYGQTTSPTPPQSAGDVTGASQGTPGPATQAAPDVTPATQPSTGTTTGGSSSVSGNPDISGTSQQATSTVTAGDVQSAQATGGGEIVVTGIRQSLANAQSIKRNSDTVVDALTADDIGALPDRSINEALQRVPGVAITRFAAPSDSQHFSVEGSGVTIRGLGYTKGEFNGRDTFAASGGREIGYNDVPTELAGDIEVYKNLTPDMIEGGISGTVSINTRKPFDQKGQVIYFSAGANYGDMEKKAAPDLVGLYSNQWTTPGGSRFGVLVGASFDQQRQRSDSVFLQSWLPRFHAPNDGVDGYAPNGTDYQGTQYDGNLCDGNNPNEGRVINAGQPYAIRVCDNFPTPAGFDTVYTPSGAGVRTQDFNTKRYSVEGGLQYESPDRSFLVTASYLRAQTTQEWFEHTIEPNIYYNDIGNTYPAGYTQGDGFPYDPNANYTFDDGGLFTSGTIVDVNNHLAHNGDLDNNCGPSDATTASVGYCNYPNFVQEGINTDFSNRWFYSKSMTQDASLNLKWEPTDRLHLNLDGQYVNSTSQNIDNIVDIYTTSDVSVDLRGKVPQVNFVTPGFDQGDYFADPGNHFYNDAMNNRADNVGHEYAVRGDAQYDLSDNGFFKAIRAGGRWSKREQTVRSNNYSNWGSLSATWTGEGPSYLTKEPGTYSNFTFSNFFRGDTIQPPTSPYINKGILSDYTDLEALLRQAKDPLNGFSYTPLEDRNGGDLVDGYFLPSEIYKNSEETYAAYARLDFGTHEFFGGLKLSGNVGVRYVHTLDDSYGAINFPAATQVLPSTYADFNAYCAAITEQNSHQAAGSSSTIPALCRPGTTSADQQAALAFASGGNVPQVAEQKFHNWLPALNLRLDLTPKLLVRFAASKAISRPAFSDLENYVTLSYDPTGGTFSARAANPYLKPVRATQFDLTAEWYFAKVGSLTGAIFYKNLKDVIIENAGISRTFVNNGVTNTLGLTGPANAAGTGHVKGAEVSYQQSYDFLPGFLSGFGSQATFTYLKSSDIAVSPPSYSAPTLAFTGNGQQPPLDITGLYDNLPLPGLSKYNFNAVAFYDKYGFYARVAYSWRSKYLLTSQDCCFPYLPVFASATGEMDASAFYTINKHVKIGVEANNLLNTDNKTRYLLNGSGLTAPKTYFISDRQYTFTARFTY